MRFEYMKIAIYMLTLTTFTTFAASGMVPEVKADGALQTMTNEATVSETQIKPPPKIKEIPQPDGFYEESGNWYYRESGSTVRDAFLVLGGELYRTNPDGALVHGWYQENEDWYYFLRISTILLSFSIKYL